MVLDEVAHHGAAELAGTTSHPYAGHGPVLPSTFRSNLTGGYAGDVAR